MGKLPASMRIRGPVVWYAYAGPYREMGEKGWQTFMRKVRTSGLRPVGPPGDVYVCDPEEHKGEKERTMITILYAPMDAAGRKS